MAYSAIANSEIDTDSPITTGLMTKYRDNIDAMRDGSGILDNAIINRHLNISSIIGQTEIKTAIQSADVASGTVSGTLVNTFTVTAPTYMIGYSYAATVYNSGGSAITVKTEIGTTKSAADGDWLTQSAIGYSTRVGTGQSFGVDNDLRYFTASPPYDLGDGEIPLFIFLALNSDGDIIQAVTDITPPWAYNGPTRTEPEYYQNGVGFYQKKTINEDSGEISVEPVEITQAIKNADKDIIPHPFFLSPGESVVLVDPVSTLELYELMQAGQRISELFFNDYLRIGSQVNRVSPAGVSSLSFSWKNSRARAGQAVKDKREKKGPYSGGG